MASFLGNLSVFDYKIHEWNVFYGKLKQFVKLNNISDTNKSAVLLTRLSDESYRLLRNLVHPKALEEIAYDELVEVFDRHFTPKRSTFADRAKFYEATRSDVESIEEWVARLRGLAVYCEFGTELDTLLRDRFVLGFKAGHERDKLFECSSKTLTLAEALEVAQKASCAREARTGVSTTVDMGAVAMKEEPVFYARAGASGGPSRSDIATGHIDQMRKFTGASIMSKFVKASGTVLQRPPSAASPTVQASVLANPPPASHSSISPAKTVVEVQVATESERVMGANRSDSISVVEQRLEDYKEKVKGCEVTAKEVQLAEQNRADLSINSKESSANASPIGRSRRPRK